METTQTGGLTAHSTFGPYRLLRSVGTTRVGDRILAVDDRSGRNVVVYRRVVGGGRGALRRELDAVEHAARAKGPHLLPIEGWGLWNLAELGWVSPWTGSWAGMVTLAELRTAKGGRLGFVEAKRAIEQVWAGSNAGRACGVTHGPISLDEVLVDQQGRVWIENYGLAWRAGSGDDTVGGRLETASIGAALVELVTGKAVPVPGWLPGLPHLPTIPGLPTITLPEVPAEWQGLPGRAAEQAVAAAVTAALRAEDALPGVIAALRGVTEQVADAEASAKSSVAKAAGDMVKSALKHAATTVFDLMRGKKGE